MALDYVSRGQKIQIPAEDYNAFVDAARGARKRHRNVPIVPPRIIDQTSTIWVHNNTGADIPFGGIIRIGDSVPDPTDTNELGDFQARIYVSGLIPNSSDSPWCVALEPIPKTMTGRALAAGVAQVKIDMNDADHEYAKSVNGDVEKLESAEPSGASDSISAEIIYTSTSSGVGWGLVRFPIMKMQRLEVVVPEITCEDDGSLSYDTKYIWVAAVETEEGS